MALARLTERAGLDLVTFQDHLYQPAFLDTWTQLSWVAAQSERVHVSANVLSLPLRPPAFSPVPPRASTCSPAVGSSSASGRERSGTQRGDGRPRRTPAQPVQALGEAIDVIRAIWDPAERRGVSSTASTAASVAPSAAPSPRTTSRSGSGRAKDGCCGIGERAVGWLPSYSYMQRGDLDRGNRIIDEAAAAAGRDPSEKRLLNVRRRLRTSTSSWRSCWGAASSGLILWGDDARIDRDLGPRDRPRRARGRGPRTISASRNG